MEIKRWQKKKILPFFLHLLFTSMNNHAIIILTRKTNQPNERQDKMLNQNQAIEYGKSIGVKYYVKTNHGCLLGGTVAYEEAVEMRDRHAKEMVGNPNFPSDVEVIIVEAE